MKVGVLGGVKVLLNQDKIERKATGATDFNHEYVGFRNVVCSGATNFQYRSSGAYGTENSQQGVLSRTLWRRSDTRNLAVR